jgi:N,N-dimethylformamidase
MFAVVAAALAIIISGLAAAVGQWTNYVPDEPLPAETVPPQESLDSLGISGYPDKLSVQPGESVRIMVSTKARTFRSTMVRIIHGDPDPAGPASRRRSSTVPRTGRTPAAISRSRSGSMSPFPTTTSSSRPAASR